jgi:transposase InsO family protein
LIERMRALARQRPRFGYRRIAVLLRREAWRASDTRVFRLWRQEGLKVPQKRRKRRRWGSSENGCHRRRTSTKTTSGAGLRVRSHGLGQRHGCRSSMSTRGSAWRSWTSITSEDVIDTLAELFAMRRATHSQRQWSGVHRPSDSRWLAQGRRNVVRRAGSPGRTATRKFPAARDEFLALEIFENLPAARELTAAWKEDYNDQRPHGSLGYQTPTQFAAACAASAPAAPTLQQHTRRDEEDEERVPFPQPLPSLSVVQKIKAGQKD